MATGSTGATSAEAGHLPDYEPANVEAKWRAAWEAADVSSSELAEGERGAYVLEMLPYPSGTLHMGHVKNDTMGDVITHFRRRNGALTAIGTFLGHEQLEGDHGEWTRDNSGLATIVQTGVLVGAVGALGARAMTGSPIATAVGTGILFGGLAGNIAGMGAAALVD
jgi:hypothetical protein